MGIGQPLNDDRAQVYMILLTTTTTTTSTTQLAYIDVSLEFS